MNDDLLLIQLRDCFTAGYTLPQFCIDNGIKKPLFVAADQNRLAFLWEIHVQFCYDKRMTANFAFVFGNVEHTNFCHLNWNVANLEIKNISDVNLSEFDKIIVLDIRRFQPKIDKTIYLDELLQKFVFRTYDEIPLLNFMKNHNGVKLFVMNHPMISRNEQNTEHEKKLMPESAENITLSEIRKKIAESNGEKIPTPYDFLGYTNKEVYELLEENDAVVNFDGSTSLQDRHNKIVSIFNGKRLTANQPEHYEHKIYFVGNCIYFGWGVPYDKTVESHLQNFLNENNLPYRVENESQFLNYRYQDIFYNLNKLPVKDGDIIFVTPFNYYSSTCFPFIDTNPIFFRPHNYGEVFADGIHINELGHKALAEKLFEFLTKNNFFQDVEFKYPKPPPPPHRYGIPKENSISPTAFLQNKELEDFKQKLRAKRFSVGAIVMNCNPFTLGHKYLIEYASKKVKKRRGQKRI